VDDSLHPVPVLFLLKVLYECLHFGLLQYFKAQSYRKLTAKQNKYSILFPKSLAYSYFDLTVEATLARKIANKFDLRSNFCATQQTKCKHLFVFAASKFAFSLAYS